MLAEPGTIAAVLEKAGLPPQHVPAALALAAQVRNDLGRDAVRGDALAALAIVHRIELSPIRLRVILSAAALSCPTPEMLDLKQAMLIRDVPLRIKRRGVEMRLVIAGPSSAAANRDPTLLKEIRASSSLAAEALVSGRVRSVAELATAGKGSAIVTSALLLLAMLAPDILDVAIAAGRQPPELTAHRLIRTMDLPIAWAAQKQLLGIP